MRTFYRTVIEIEVLTEDEYEFQTLGDIQHDIDEGHASGQFGVKSSEKVTGLQMAELLKAQGSDASFLLDDMDDEPCFKVEYDKEYYGGNYSKVGELVYIPLLLVEGEDENELVKKAFTYMTELDSVHIVNYNLDEKFDSDGNEWEEE